MEVLRKHQVLLKFQLSLFELFARAAELATLLDTISAYLIS